MLVLVRGSRSRLVPPDEEATDITELGRGGGGPMGVLANDDGANDSLLEITFETTPASVACLTLIFRLICQPVRVILLSAEKNSIPDPTLAA